MSAAAASRRALAAALALLLVLLALLVYAPVAGHRFVGLDDIPYVTGNPVVQQGPTLAGLRWAFTAFAWGNWHPLTWLSHMLDVRLFGPWAGGHHLTSVALHAASAALLFLALLRMTGAPWAGAAVAALFAVHPLHVESVAWVAERKDVLCALFWMLALLAYARYARRPGTARLLAVGAAFAAALLAKPMAVTLPCVLLLLDAWPLGRWSTRPGGRTLASLALEKAPLFALSAASSVVTVLAQRSGEALRSWDEFPLGLRASNALLAGVRYLGKTLAPADLVVFYPAGAVPAWQAAGAAALLAAITAAALLAARRRPYLLAGWLWYLGTLAPVIGLVQAGGQAMADRYTYLPLVGIFVAAAWGAAALLPAGRPWRALAAAGVIAIVATLGIGARRQLGHWRDDASLFRHLLAVDPDSPFGLLNLGNDLIREGKVAEGQALLARAYRGSPAMLAGVHYLTGNRLMAAGQREEALAHYRSAVDLAPSSGEIRDALRRALDGRVTAIRAQYGPMIGAGGGAAAEGWYRQGVALGREKLYEEALASLREAVRLAPGRAEARSALGVTYANLGRTGEAVAAFEEALRLQPGLRDARAALEQLRPAASR